MSENKVYVVAMGFPQEGWGLYGVYSNREAAEAHALAMAKAERDKRVAAHKRWPDVWNEPEDVELLHVEAGRWRLGVDDYVAFEFALKDSYGADKS